MTVALTVDLEQVLDQAMFVFWQHGYQASSIPMLLTAMRLSRAQFYSLFGDKTQLFRQVMTRYQAYMHDVVVNLLEHPTDPAEGIRQVFELTVFTMPRERRELGCLFVNALTELSTIHPEIAHDVLLKRNRVEQAFIGACGRAIVQQQIQVALTDQQAGRMLMTLLTGLRVQSRSGATEQMLRQNVEPLLSLLFVAQPAPMAAYSFH